MLSKNIITYGCRLNIYESEVMQKHLEKANLKNYILFNSCSVTNEAKKKVIDDIRKFKKKYPNKKIIVTGCASQIDSKTFLSMSEVDHVIGNKEKMEFETFLKISNEKIANKISDIMELKTIAPQFIESFENHSRAFIQIQNGCDHRCTFCTIPYGRGNSRSLPINNIIEQIKMLNEKGFNEIILTGVGNDNDIKTLPIIEGQLPVEISKRALNAVSLSGEDVVIFDTAGRTQIDQQMMMELKQLENEIQPHEIVLVADSLTGQDAVNIAQEFQKTVNLSSIILTRIDGDGKGGAALSMKAVTGCPIKFLATGEKIDQLEAFHPDRIANRILGMGDVVSLVEKVAEDLEQEKIEKIEEDIKKGSFTFDTYLQQIRQMKKVGGMSGVLSMMPGVSKMKKQIDESNLDESLLSKQEAIILSMTQKERDNPKIIGGSRKKRIANGSGTDISMVNKLLKQHKMMTNVMKKMSKGGRGALQGLDGIPPDLLNNLK
jgi:hypothetical protein